MNHRVPLAFAMAAALCATVPAPALASAAHPAAAPAAKTPLVKAPDPRAPRSGVVRGARTVRAEARRNAAIAKFRELHQQRVQPRAFEQIHHFWGVEPTATSHDGLQATQNVDPNYRVSYNGDFTYTPTMKAAGSCMEITTAYWRYSGAVQNEVWAWDWCGDDGPRKEIRMDAAFIDTYTTTVNGHMSYSVQIVKTGTNGWSSYLYNYKTSTWQLFYSKSGRDTSGLAYGWNIFEIYATRNPRTGTAYYCTDAKNVVFESNDIKLRKNGTWSLASPANSPWEPYTNPNPNDYLCPTLKFIKAGANDHWIVRQ